MAQTEKGSEVKDFTADPIDSDKILGFKTSDGTRWFTLSRFMNWLKTKTASTVTSGDKTPVNSDAVNGALTNLTRVKITVKNDANDCIPDTDSLEMYSCDGTNCPNNDDGLIISHRFRVGGQYPIVHQTWYNEGTIVEYQRNYNVTTKLWGDWVQNALKSDLSNCLKYEVQEFSLTTNNQGNIVLSTPAPTDIILAIYTTNSCAYSICNYAEEKYAHFTDSVGNPLSNTQITGWYIYTV